MKEQDQVDHAIGFGYSVGGAAAAFLLLVIHWLGDSIVVAGVFLIGWGLYSAYRDWKKLD
jgi:hypothetical protein